MHDFSDGGEEVSSLREVYRMYIFHGGIMSRLPADLKQVDRKIVHPFAAGAVLGAIPMIGIESVLAN